MLSFPYFQDRFRQFENKLATSAARLKKESLTQQAKSVALHSREVCEKLKTVIETRGSEKLTCLETELDLVGKDGAKLLEAFDDIESKDEDLEILTNVEVQKLLKEVEDKLLKGTSEEEAVQHFLDEINRKIQNNLKSKRDITDTALQKWKRNMKFDKLKSLTTPSLKQLMSLQVKDYLKTNTISIATFITTTRTTTFVQPWLVSQLSQLLPFWLVPV